MIAGLGRYPAYMPSGIEWLGNVPKHCKVRRLRNIVDVRFRNVDKHSKNHEIAVRLCNYKDVCHNDRSCSDVDFMRATATDDKVDRFRLATGDVLITKDSETLNYIWVPALVESADPNHVCGDHLALVRPNASVTSGRFLGAVLSSPNIATQFRVNANGVMRLSLSQKAITSTWIPARPLPEQTATVRFLNDTIGKTTNAIGQAIRVIHLFRKYRTRLIADAVTGKFGVREATAGPPEPNPAAAQDGRETVRPKPNPSLSDNTLGKEANP